MDEAKSGSLSHVDPKGKPQMVDVSNKDVTRRTAWARSTVLLEDDIMKRLVDGELVTSKGPVFNTAIIAGTMAAKNTASLIPFCHPLNIDDIKIEVTTREDAAIIDCKVGVDGKTGVEMEAITGASIAAVTVYDMCKALSHDIIISETLLMEKTGGKSDFRRDKK